MGKTVDSMFRSVGLDTVPLVPTVEDNKITIEILSAVLLFCLVPKRFCVLFVASGASGVVGRNAPERVVTYSGVSAI